MKKKTPSKPVEKSEQRENWYTPELAEWFSGSRSIGDDNSRTFEIHEIAYETCGTSPIQVTGPLVATVTIAPEFGKEDAAAIARLMRGAPSLYQALKQVAPNALNDTDGLRDFNQALLAMFEAVNHYPYAMPQ